MNDFDDRLSRALRDEDVDRTVHPDLVAARSVWRRRRHRRLGAIGAALSVVVVGSGLSIATLAQSNPDERVVTDTAPSTEPLSSVPTAATPTTDVLVSTPTTDVPVPTPTTDVSVPPPTTESPSTTSPASTESVVSAPTPELGGLDIADQYIDATTVFDLDNRLEIRDAANAVLWSYQYCEAGQRCSAAVQTVLQDGVWVVVGERLDDRGYPSSSTLRRVDVDGRNVEVRAETEAGTFLVAGQPTVLGDLLAVGETVPAALGKIDVSVILADGEVRELATDVTDVEVSADGRYLATTTSRPALDHDSVDLVVVDLLTGESNDITLPGLMTAAPIEFSADGSRLVMLITWEIPAAFIIDPWVATAELVAADAVTSASDICLVDATTAAAATWNVAYAEAEATNGTIRLVDVETGEVTTDLGLDTYGGGLVCGADGSVTFVRVPLIAKNFGTEDDPYIFVEPDFEAPVDIVRVAVDGTQAVMESGEVGIDGIR